MPLSVGLTHSESFVEGLHPFLSTAPPTVGIHVDVSHVARYAD
ncbi:hypothetical protein [Pseudomonas sp.]|nr:hypothetical protein [Pseudomonas sp.]